MVPRWVNMEYGVMVDMMVGMLGEGAIKSRPVSAPGL
jgi:hypothetical protein